jgi:hypothetical protein
MPTNLIEKKKPEIGATVRIRVLSGETVEGTVVHLWEERGIQMARVSAGNLVYNVPARMLADERKSK